MSDNKIIYEHKNRYPKGNYRMIAVNMSIVTKVKEGYTEDQWDKLMQQALAVFENAKCEATGNTKPLILVEDKNHE